jgi:hypothetical protein
MTVKCQWNGNWNIKTCIITFDVWVNENMVKWSPTGECGQREDFNKCEIILLVFVVTDHRPNGIFLLSISNKLKISRASFSCDNSQSSQQFHNFIALSSLKSFHCLKVLSHNSFFPFPLSKNNCHRQEACALHSLSLLSFGPVSKWLQFTQFQFS